MAAYNDLLCFPMRLAISMVCVDVDFLHGAPCSHEASPKRWNEATRWMITSRDDDVDESFFWHGFESAEVNG